jgi:hypothetical protein
MLMHRGVSDPDNHRKSTTGFVFKVGQSAIAWTSYAQKSVARSSTEAELMALSDATQEAVWLARLGNDLLISQDSIAITLHEDNQSTICLANATIPCVTSRRTKHIDVRYWYVNAQVQNEVVKLAYLPSSDMIADILTKPLGRIQFTKLRAMLGVNDICKE